MLVVAAILGGAFLLIRPSLPTAQRVSYRLPAGVRSLEVDYVQGGSVVRSARFSWAPEASPEVFRHEPELAGGATRLVVRWADPAGVLQTVRRTVELVEDRVTHVDLRP